MDPESQPGFIWVVEAYPLRLGHLLYRLISLVSTPHVCVALTGIVHGDPVLGLDSLRTWRGLRMLSDDME